MNIALKSRSGRELCNIECLLLSWNEVFNVSLPRGTVRSNSMSKIRCSKGVLLQYIELFDVLCILKAREIPNDTAF